MTVIAPAGAGGRPEKLGPTPGAGSVQGGLVCGQCGALLEPDSAFCDMCGAPVSRVSPPSGDETALSSPPASDQAPVYEPTVASQERGWQASAGGALQAPTPSDDALRPKPQGALVVRGSNVTLDLVSGTLVWVIGREDPLSGIFPDIDLTDHGGDEGGVSRKHARIQVQGQRFYVEDLNSTNHTYLNRELLTPGYTYPLRDGDELCFGRVKVIFRSS
ncbi:MAG: FHA domain-containing protein [Anaerolineae bacterium]